MKRRSKITALLEEPEFRRFEAFCLERGHKKSTLIALLIRDHLNNQGFTMQEALPLSRQAAASASASAR